MLSGIRTKGDVLFEYDQFKMHPPPRRSGLQYAVVRFGGSKFESQLIHIAFVVIVHEIISMVILPFLLIQEGQKSEHKYW